MKKLSITMNTNWLTNKPQFNTVKKISGNYNTHLNLIVQFVMLNITEVFGKFSSDEIKEKLGKPVINYDNGQVNYLEQSFDDMHIITFEFLDDEFSELQYFSIDGWQIDSSVLNWGLFTMNIKSL